MQCRVNDGSSKHPHDKISKSSAGKHLTRSLLDGGIAHAPGMAQRARHVSELRTPELVRVRVLFTINARHLLSKQLAYVICRGAHRHR